MIEVEDLKKNYGTTQALRGVSFKIDKGEVVGFLGPNGAGKTTAMRILTCFMPASGGRAAVAGYDVFKESLEVRKHIGYLPESVPLYPEMTVTGYLKFVAKIKGTPRGVRAERLNLAIDACGLNERRNQIVGHLSKGFRQRVGLAQALIHDPDVLILDEPTSGLDPRQIVEIRELIKNLGKERTIILSTHILPEASMTCERLIVINEGRITGNVKLLEGRAVSIESGEGEHTELGGEKTIHLEAAAPADAVPAVLNEIPDVSRVENQGLSPGNNPTFHVGCDSNVDIRAQISSRIIQNGWGLLEMRPVEMTLEELFLKLTTQADKGSFKDGSSSQESEVEAESVSTDDQPD